MGLLKEGGTKGARVMFVFMFHATVSVQRTGSDITHLPGYGGGELGQTRSPMCPSGWREKDEFTSFWPHCLFYRVLVDVWLRVVGRVDWMR